MKAKNLILSLIILSTSCLKISVAQKRKIYDVEENESKRKRVDFNGLASTMQTNLEKIEDKIQSVSSKIASLESLADSQDKDLSVIQNLLLKDPLFKLKATVKKASAIENSLINPKERNFFLEALRAMEFGSQENALTYINLCPNLNKVDVPYSYKTLLSQAIYKNLTEIIKILIDKGADVNQRFGFISSKTPLIHAIECNSKEAAILLIETGKVNLNAKDYLTGNTALHIAIEKNNWDIINLLINENEADLNIKNKYGIDAATALTIPQENKVFEAELIPESDIVTASVTEGQVFEAEALPRSATEVEVVEVSEDAIGIGIQKLKRKKSYSPNYLSFEYSQEDDLKDGNYVPEASDCEFQDDVKKTKSKKNYSPNYLSFEDKQEDASSDGNYVP